MLQIIHPFIHFVSAKSTMLIKARSRRMKSREARCAVLVFLVNDSRVCVFSCQTDRQTDRQTEMIL